MDEPTHDFRFESKYDAFGGLLSDNSAVDANLEALTELGILRLIEHETQYILFIAVSATLNHYTLAQQLQYCMLLFHLEKLITATPASVPAALKTAIDRCTTEEKLNAYDNHTQIKMTIAQLAMRHFDPGNEERNSAFNHQAHAFIKFCFSNEHSININQIDLDLPNTLVNLKEAFESHYSYRLNFFDAIPEPEAEPMQLSM
ncbi:MAG: hypothetical protein P1U40_08340 [Coxiellaceae bacterium]|nr:hypothetical protein [Coxiellaceae bacterium]